MLRYYSCTFVESSLWNADMLTVVDNYSRLLNQVLVNLISSQFQFHSSFDIELGLARFVFSKVAGRTAADHSRRQNNYQIHSYCVGFALRVELKRDAKCQQRHSVVCNC